VHFWGITVNFTIESASLQRARKSAESVKTVDARIPAGDLAGVFAKG
jgi:hypothetical protein